ncbi:CD225/dispanin family protein [Pseudoxanthomonas putridarboris]|uniref:CD225/dispanin family protein n=1 Tax=Pseudoxanthomonas putridarboris TaxID=752605 RepID=A0ABU9J450_9GAMM
MSAMPPLPSQPAPYIPNHLVWAILSTLFCCLPFGVVSIVFAAQVDGKRMAGDIAGAQESSRKAKLWAIVSAATALVPITLYLLFVSVIGGVGLLGGFAG